MKKILIILYVVLLALPMRAQTIQPEVKTILFLIPFYSQQYNAEALLEVKSCDDLKKIASFQLMGFWAGAQVALEEYESENVRLRVIVRDVTDNDNKVRKIMEDTSLMNHVDLIIGPFFNKQFTIAARYAQKYKIPIVNPFTSRTDIIEENEYVYKLVPSLETRAITIEEILSQGNPESRIFIYADTVKSSKEYKAYTRYFNNKKIKYKTVPLQQNLVPLLSKTNKNIVIVLTSELAKILMLSRDLIFNADLANLLLIVPEEWINVATYDIEYYSKLNVHFFSDYYVDYTNEKTQVFIHKYISKYHTLPTLESFAFQGYDVTRYFVSALYNDMDLDRVKVETLGYHFSFDKIENGGYENFSTNATFLEVKENEIQPARY